MMRFIEVQGRYINLAHVRKIAVYGKLPNLTARWEWADGTSESGEINGSDATLLHDLPYKEHELPATPGYWIVSWWKNDETGDETVDRDQVIAWHLDTQVGGFHKAFGVWLESSDGEFTAVETPDGRVIDLGDCCHENIEAWIKTCRINKQEREKQKVK